MKKPLLLIIFFITTIIGLSIMQVGISSRVSTAGIELDNLQSQIAKYKKENTILNEKVLESSALINLSNKAEALGFVEVKSQVYLSNPLPLALSNSQD